MIDVRHHSSTVASRSPASSTRRRRSFATETTATVPAGSVSAATGRTPAPPPPAPAALLLCCARWRLCSALRPPAVPLLRPRAASTASWLHLALPATPPVPLLHLAPPATPTAAWLHHVAPSRHRVPSPPLLQQHIERVCNLSLLILPSSWQTSSRINIYQIQPKYSC
jgi:hypothetical protein